MTRVFRYILVSDHGMAPCPFQGLITLGTCKPQIRRGAAPGDWVIGFRPRPHARGLVLWAGKVASSLEHGDYQQAHGERPDAVYRQATDGSYIRLDPDYHPSDKEMRRDLSGPVLLFDPAFSVHLQGNHQPLPAELAHLAAAGRGHRVAGTDEGDVANLAKWVRQLRASKLDSIDPRPLDKRCGTKTVPVRIPC